MATEQIVKGNPADFELALLDVDGLAVADLPSATDTTFVLRKADQLGTTPTPELTLPGTPASSKIVLDTPSTGSVTVSADSADLAIAPGLYDLFFQVKFSAARILEYQILRAVQVLDQAATN